MGRRGQFQRVDGAPLQLMSFIQRVTGDVAAAETGMGEQHAAQRTTAEPCQPARQRAARRDGQYRVREDGGDAVNGQDDLSDPSQSSARQTEDCTFVARRYGEFLRQQMYRECAKALQTGRQRAAIKQPDAETAQVSPPGQSPVP